MYNMSEIRKLKIKANACKRLKKDIEFYNRELDENNDKIETLVEEKADKYDIKKQKEIVEETTNVLNMCETQLDGALDELRKYIQELYENNPNNVRETTQFKEAELWYSSGAEI